MDMPKATPELWDSKRHLKKAKKQITDWLDCNDDGDRDLVDLVSHAVLLVESAQFLMAKARELRQAGIDEAADAS